MIVGVGVALAKAKGERERRAAARSRRERSASLLPREARAAGLQRIVVGQLELAIELLEGDGAGNDETTVHELRKLIKRVRAIVRLLREELGEKRFARENDALRGCAARVAGTRDAAVMVDTLDALLQREPRLGTASGVGALRAQLVREREAAAAGGRDAELRGAVAADLRAIRSRAATWELRERRGRPERLLTAGVERVYEEGRGRMRRARRRGDLESMHAWRKRVKALRYVAETLDRGGAARKTKSGRRLRRVARRADRIGEMLGEEHDLALLARVVRERAVLFAGERKRRKLLLKAIARRRKRLRKRALREGERLYERKPKAFVGRLREAL